MMDDAFLLALSLKFAGAFAGAVLSVIFLPPKTRGEFIRRFSLSLIAGLLFGDAVHDYFKWGDTWRMDIAAAAVTSMLSWFVIGAALRIIGSWKPTKSE